MALPDLEKVAKSLLWHEGSLYRVCKELGMTRAELRKMLDDHPELHDAALEAAELGLDEAEETLYRSMRAGTLADRLKAASFMRRRGGR